jgi:hypothetical protein
VQYARTLAENVQIFPVFLCFPPKKDFLPKKVKLELENFGSCGTMYKLKIPLSQKKMEESKGVV